MKLLIGIMTCHSLNYKDPADPLNRDWWDSYRSKDPALRQAAIRETWLRNYKGDYKFFFGRSTKQPQPDEVFLDTKDTYRDNSYKVAAMCRWALERGYDYMLRLDDDSYIYTDRLLASDWAQYDYSGSPCGGFHIGAVTFFSKKTMELIASSPITHWADDAWVGTVASKNRILMHTIEGMHVKVGNEYIIKPENFALDHKYSALHSCLPSVMREFHRRELEK